jgi:capping protein beta
MEVRANEAFDVYRELYYEGGVSSVYFWNLDDGFAGVVLLKKGRFLSNRGVAISGGDETDGK